LLLRPQFGRTPRSIRLYQLRDGPGMGARYSPRPIRICPEWDSVGHTPEHFPGMRDAGVTSVRFVSPAAVQQTLEGTANGKEVG
jgi:hypothetical protein